MAVQQLPTPTRDRDQANRDMAEHGYTLIADALTPRQAEAMKERLIEQSLAEGPLKGEARTMDDEHLRFDTGALLNKGAIFLELLDPDALTWLVVGDTLEPSVEPVNAGKWNLQQRFLLGGLDGTLKRLEISTSGEKSKMAHLNPLFHIDQAMVPWWTEDPLVVNTFFCLTEYTVGNGGTLVVPGTHLLPTPDWDTYSGDDAIVIEAPAGTALLVDGRCWHAAGINTNGELRASLAAYSRVAVDPAAVADVDEPARGRRRAAHRGPAADVRLRHDVPERVRLVRRTRASSSRRWAGATSPSSNQGSASCTSPDERRPTQAGSVPWPMRAMKRSSLARMKNSAVRTRRIAPASTPARSRTSIDSSANTYHSCTTRWSRSTARTSKRSKKAA